MAGRDPWARGRRLSLQSTAGAPHECPPLGHRLQLSLPRCTSRSWSLGPRRDFGVGAEGGEGKNEQGHRMSVHLGQPRPPSSWWLGAGGPLGLRTLSGKWQGQGAKQCDASACATAPYFLLRPLGSAGPRSCVRLWEPRPPFPSGLMGASTTRSQPGHVAPNGSARPRKRGVVVHRILGCCYDGFSWEYTLW